MAPQRAPEAYRSKLEDPFYSKPFITVTGADPGTNIEELGELQAEVGLLYSATPQDDNRYPGEEWIKEAASYIPHVALHVCGLVGRMKLFRGDLDPILDNVQRVQINGRPIAFEINELHARWPGLKIITQYSTNHRGYVLNLSELSRRAVSEHAYVMDNSGGMGKLPKEWTRPATSADVGFAGGLNADNLEEELPKIMQVATGRWWIDMESGMRTDDWFDIHKAERAALIFRLLTREQDER